MNRASAARRVLSPGAALGSAGVFLARPLVGSRWTAAQGPLAQKTPTLPHPVARATRRATLCGFLS